jgi:hypothetical protein
MASREIELAQKRGRLQERIAQQRSLIAAHMAPVASALATADRTLAVGRAGITFVKRNPLQVGVAFAVMAILRPRRMWRWGRRVFVAWGLWRKLRDRLHTVGLVADRPS